MFNRRKFLKSGIYLGAPFAAAKVHAANPPLGDTNLGLPPTDFNISNIVRKTVPSSGVSVPVIGIGTNRYGAGRETEVFSELKKVLAAFSTIGNGIVDTAPQYGESEKVIGRLLAELKTQDELFIASKCDVSGGATTQAQLVNSSDLLHKSPLDLVAIHNLKHWREQLPTLQELKAEKALHHIGITTSRASQYSEMEKVMLSESLDFVQLNYSILDRNAQRLLDIAQDKGFAVMVNLPFGRGKVFRKTNGHALPAWAGELEINSWAQFALKYIVSHPAVSCAIPGTRKLKHLNDNLLAAVGPMPTSKQRKKMELYFEQL